MLSILIVNWNTREFLKACLASLPAPLRELEHEIIVVDCASGDGSAEMVTREFPAAILIASGENLGFAAGNNLAFERASGEFIWLLNPDTEVLGEAPCALLDFLMQNPTVGGAASALIDARDGHIQRSCRTFPTPAALWAQASGLASAFPRSRRFGFYKMGDWNRKTIRQIEQPMASSLMLRREAIGAAGGLFDVRFPIFFNDVDLCLRLKNAGWPLWFVPDARVRHWGGGATSQIRAAMIEESHRSLRRFYELHYRGRISPLIYGPTVWMSDLAGALRARLAKRKAAA